MSAGFMIPAANVKRAVAKKARRNKFNAIKTMIGELRFDSKKEAQCWTFLMARLRAGEIENLERQVKYTLFAFSEAGAVKVCTYIADFRYRDKKTGATVVSDAKGVKTALFNLKAKMMKVNYGIEVELM